MTLNQSIRLALLGSAVFTVASADELPEVNVTADFYDTPALELGSSVSVFNDVVIQERGADHLEQLFNLAPNVNYSAGASRGRFIQIRGIGERSQFVAPVNSSVGVLIDGIDFTGISTAASLLDVKQVEILRGPQGTLYGANALAGLVSVLSHGPSEETSGNVGVTIGEYDTRIIKGAVGGSINDQWGYRLAAQSQVSNGYMENTYLNRDDTNNIDESTFRGKLRWTPSDALTVDFTAFFADVDNGYDAFSLDNNRNTMSDQPGTDAQETQAASIQAAWKIRPATEIQVNLSHADSELEYGYDEDWAYPELCADFGCVFGPDDGYSSYDSYLRDNKNSVIDARVVNGEKGSRRWVAGVYAREQQVDLTRIYTYLNNDFSSSYDTENSALYGQLEQPLSDALTGIVGLRYEEYRADYADSEGFTSTPEEDLVGGKLGLEYRLADEKMLYGLVSRGYKAGGFNADAEVPENRREFKSESMWNYEFGWKGSFQNGRGQAQLAVFYQDREDIQAKQYFAIGGTVDNPSTTFVDFIDNAASGHNYGVEAEASWVATDKLTLFGSLGLLKTQFDDFSYFDADGNETVKDGRDQAHAPEYQFSLATNYLFTPALMGRLEVEGKDAFYFSDSHDQKSDAYTLLNARLSYFYDDWEFALWGRNLTDEGYYVRGFEFPNDPRDGWQTHAYTQLGEPRIVGVSANYSF